MSMSKLRPQDRQCLWEFLIPLYRKSRDENDIQLALLGSREQCVALRTAVFGARSNFLYGGGDGPATSGGELVQRVSLHGQGLLVVGRDARIERRTLE